MAPVVKTPPCKHWNVWLGKEIEGTKDIGVETLFLRRLPPPDTKSATAEKVWSELERANRVWFCHEIPLRVIRDVVSQYPNKTYCVEVIWGTFRHSDCDKFRSTLDQCVVYYKLPPTYLAPKEGDFVCIGAAYNDEAFEIGKGAKVAPDQYLNDERIW